MRSKCVKLRLTAGARTQILNSRLTSTFFQQRICFLPVKVHVSLEAPYVRVTSILLCAAFVFRLASSNRSLRWLDPLDNLPPSKPSHGG
jgi:hypothetical protein